MEIEATDTSRLEPGMSGTDLVQTLVLQFLQHDGYVETARAFAEDIRAQKEALNLDTSVSVEGINIKDDEDANNRQREPGCPARALRRRLTGGARNRHPKINPRGRH